MKKVLITAINSFTGIHLEKYLSKEGFEVVGTTSKTWDITKIDDIITILNETKPNFIIHLAAISFVGHNNDEDFYKINTIGTINLLNAILKVNLELKKVILSSSATVYGNQGLEILDESLCPVPANHYGASKYAMECLARNYFDKLPIIISRPFNYTGVGQAEHFLIPKIVKHFKEKKNIIELGNLDIKREFNDVNFICDTYKRLLLSEVRSEVVNIASQSPISLLDIIKILNRISGYEIKVKVNQLFVRKDEIKSLTGSNEKLLNIIGHIEYKPLEETLRDMLKA